MLHRPQEDTGASTGAEDIDSSALAGMYTGEEQDEDERSKVYPPFLTRVRNRRRSQGEELTDLMDTADAITETTDKNPSAAARLSARRGVSRPGCQKPSPSRRLSHRRVTGWACGHLQPAQTPPLAREGVWE